MADPNRDVKPRLPRLPGQSGLNVKPRLPRLPGQRGRASLVAAAASQPTTAKSGPSSSARVAEGESGPSAGPEAMDVDTPADASASGSQPAAGASAGAPGATGASGPSRPVAGPSSVSMTASRSGSGAPSGASAPASASASTGPKMKFKPKMPIRRAPQGEVEVKAEPGTAAVRGRGPRGRGRGGMRGGRGGAANTIAAGPFGGTRAPTQRRLAVPPPPPRNLMAGGAAEVYSDNEDGTGGRSGGVIDIEAVSALSESAPTSMFRDRDVDGSKAKAKAADKAKLKDLKKRRKAARAERAARAARLAAGDLGGIAETSADVKAEPVSPLHGARALPDPSAAPGARVADSMIPGDEVQDRDEAGRRVRALTDGTADVTEGTPDEEVNEAQRVDLSESESEDEEDDMEGDFVYVPGLDNPEDKLFTFQFPPGMPKFVSRKPVDADALPDEAPETQKPTPAALAKARKKGGPAAPPPPPPEGRIGTLCVMKSGKVKLVLGEGEAGIVMNVTPGVPTTFIQQLVHMDAKHKSTTVLGEVHKQYVVTPDIDRLLEELFINGGETPGDRARQQAEMERRARMERGLVKMEPSSP